MRTRDRTGGVTSPARVARLSIDEAGAGPVRFRTFLLTAGNGLAPELTTGRRPNRGGRQHDRVGDGCGLSPSC